MLVVVLMCFLLLRLCFPRQNTLTPSKAKALDLLRASMGRPSTIPTPTRKKQTDDYEQELDEVRACVRACARSRARACVRYSTALFAPTV